MSGSPAVAPGLTDEQLAELIGLLEEADSAELKVTVVEEEHHSALSALGLDPLDAQIRQVYFFDTPDLTLYESGLVVRARRAQGKGDDTAVKLRPVVPKELPAKLRRTDGFGVEVDAMPGGFVCSATIKGAPGKNAVRPAILEGRSVRKLFSKDQRALYAEHAPDGLELDDLEVLGPVFVLKLKSSPEGYGGRLVIELWLYPDSSAVLELSTKCAPGEAFQVAAEARVFLTQRDIDVGGEQEPKTRKALEFFAGRLR